MPALTRWCIRAALVNLVVALVLGVGLELGAALLGSGWPGLSAARPVFYHLLMLGGLAQFIFGVAWWMFPPLSRTRPRGPEGLGWVGFGLLNGGLALRAEPVAALDPQPWARATLILGALSLTLAGWIFAGLLWPRIRGRPGKEN
ncbi:MAG: hypothetical protein C4316_06990 [Chloroflexota bacterium]